MRSPTVHGCATLLSHRIQKTMLSSDRRTRCDLCLVDAVWNVSLHFRRRISKMIHIGRVVAFSTCMRKDKNWGNWVPLDTPTWFDKE